MTTFLEQIEQLAGPIVSANAKNEKKIEGIDDWLKREQGETQTWVTKRIILVFIFCTLIIFLFVFLSYPNQKDWEEPAKFLLSVVTSVLLPIVTLVLGYYFGSENKKGNNDE